jgi:ABC-2 type transport system ATP-binding protein
MHPDLTGGPAVPAAAPSGAAAAGAAARNEAAGAGARNEAAGAAARNEAAGAGARNEAAGAGARNEAARAIAVAGLGKSYGAVRAVRDVSFSVGQGEIVALLGPNGAGKTTTLEILEGFRARDGGQVRVLGLDPGDKSAARELRERTGLVLQDIAVEPYLTVRETIARQAGYYRAPRDVAVVISLAGLAGLERRKVRSLSGGQKRRLDLALGLIGDPELLYLDEPTTGFDPAARRGAWDLVRQLRTAGTTILLTTHDMAEAQALADRVVLLSDGAVVAEGPPAELGRTDGPGGAGRARAEHTRITFTLPPDVALADLPVAGTQNEGSVVIETAQPVAELHRLTSWAVRHDVLLAGLTVDRPSLEDVYLRLTREEVPFSPQDRRP